MIYTNEKIKQKNAMNKKIQLILKCIIYLIMIFVFFVAVYIEYEKYIKKEKNISLFGIKQYVVMTGSMEPNYNIGDLIVVKHVKQDEIKIDDVITFDVGNDRDTISHRVIDTKEQDGNIQYQTKGDNNNAPDTELVDYDQIQGKVIFKISKFGMILTELTTGTGAIVIVAIAILSYLRASRSEEKRIAREDARRRYNEPKYEKDETK